jgi:hypothetical protein
MKPNQFFVKITIYLVLWKQLAQEFALHLLFSLIGQKTSAQEAKIRPNWSPWLSKVFGFLLK